MGKKEKETRSTEELKVRVGELDRELFLLRNELALNRKLEKPHLLRAKKREKARALTRITQLQVQGV